GFELKRPKKRLLKADADKRAQFVALYATLRAEAERIGAKIFFVDEAHVRADADLRGKWVLRGQPALVASTSPRLGEKATYYSAVCLETGEVEEMEPEGNCTARTSAAFLRALRANHPQPLGTPYAASAIVIWDNGPAHRGEPIRELLATPDLKLRLVSLPAYSPDFNADEMVWDWLREEVTANACLGSKAKVQDKTRQFFQRLAGRADEVRRRCRTVLQAQADALPTIAAAMIHPPNHVDLTLGLV
ncbi:MAG: IS630 family transposase, partial [Anaerolineae bacterium]